MDNPGLAFLKQMYDPKISTLVFGKNSKLYKLCLNTSLKTKPKTLPITIFSNKTNQMSIERHYIMPNEVSGLQLYLFVYALLRDKLLSMIYIISLKTWETMDPSQTILFGNKHKMYRNFKIFFQEVLGKTFIQRFAKLMKRIDFSDNEGDLVFLKVHEIDRFQLIAEFELFFCEQPIIPLQKINDTSGETIKPEMVNTWLDKMKLRDQSECVFILLKAKSIDQGMEDVTPFGFDKQRAREWIADKYLVVLLNERWMNAQAIRLKKCLKQQFSIPRANTISLNDCLSKIILCY